MPLCSELAGVHCYVQLRRGSGGIEPRSTSTDVREPAEWVADEVALAVDLLDEAFGLEEGERAAQCRRADLVVRCQVGLGGEAVAAFEFAGRDLGPEVVGDGLSAGNHGCGRHLSHRDLSGALSLSVVAWQRQPHSS